MNPSPQPRAQQSCPLGPRAGSIVNTRASTGSHAGADYARKAERAWLLSEYGDNAALADRADQFCALATEQGFSVWRAQGTMYRGLAKVTDGEVTEGMSLLRAGLADYRTNASEAETSAYKAPLAKACEIAGQVDEALALLDEALQILERAGKGRFAAELRRQKGQLLLRQGHSEAAEELYRKALSIAR